MPLSFRFIMKGIVNMFFKKSNQNSTKNADIACWVTFTFWGLILLINSVYEIIFSKSFVSSSLTILIAGLVIFFCIEVFLAVSKKTKKP